MRRTIQRRALPQPRFARQLPQRGSQGCFAPGNGGAKGTSCQREAKSLPYGLSRFWQQSFNKPLCCVGFGSPSWRPLQLAMKNYKLVPLSQYTPSASLRSAAPSEREPRRLRRFGSPIRRPLQLAAQTLRKRSRRLPTPLRYAISP